MFVLSSDAGYQLYAVSDGRAELVTQGQRPIHGPVRVGDEIVVLVDGELSRIGSTASNASSLSIGRV